jgi:hypothetical protein
MLRVTVDIFSGRPNPTWIITDDNEVNWIRKGIAERRGAISKAGQGFQGLGYRGIHISLLGDDDEELKLPAEFVIANDATRSSRQLHDIARRIIEGMTKHAKIRLPVHDETPLDKTIQKFALESFAVFDKAKFREWKLDIVATRGVRVTVRDPKCEEGCQYEESRFNPAFWNSNSYVMEHNNCYNYARNWKTNTFAQPGKASGNPNGTMSCPKVTAAAISDGFHRRCDCLPQSEYPRRLVALVIAPGADYHWYRKQKGNFWGHKPGRTAAKKTDNSGAVITNPETCNRGPYTQFCGYFYAGKSVKII